MKLSEEDKRAIAEGLNRIRTYQFWGHSLSCASVAYMQDTAPAVVHRLGGVPGCPVGAGEETYEGRHRKNG